MKDKLLKVSFWVLLTLVMVIIGVPLIARAYILDTIGWP